MKSKKEIKERIEKLESKIIELKENKYEIDTETIKEEILVLKWVIS